MSPSIQRQDPPYVQVVTHIRNQIQSGELKDGDAIPSARRIVRDWGISLATATKVLASLRSEGLVRAVPGIGTVVTVLKEQHTSARDRFQTIRRTGRIYPANEAARIKACEVVSAPGQVADALGLESGANAIRRHRITMNTETNTPVSASVSWFDAALAEHAPRLLTAERLMQGTPTYIAEQTGRVATSGRDQQCAAVATEQEAEDLGLQPGMPVLRGRNWLYDQEGDVIEYGESVTVSGRWSTYEYRLAEDQGA
ncbi:GntR family transcriptional regulator [Spongiactinospora sp. TRM90649]|uniref:GntR family transcriptional regulator n=1 Tax=Spongiactinospora sp. TRM90649 TaxID=3031114 RepID=UPI0023F62496|nr:GntR family transcriptional regulator [Spongiactinospora sp. TRM90649]MDF5758648.1 GntR family transcriptional regulator [Spongiactinospora sp. TRM90649]